MGNYPEEKISYSDLDKEPPEELKEAAFRNIRWCVCNDSDCDGGTWVLHRSGWNQDIECNECGNKMTYVG